MPHFIKTLCLTCFLSFLFLGSAHAEEPIKIGVISEHNLWAQMAINQDNGVWLAAEEVNAEGGICFEKGKCHTLEVLYRNGGSGTSADVLRDVEGLVHRQGVKLLAGTAPDNIGLAVSEFAKRNKVFFLKGTDGTNKQIWENGHKYFFRFDVSNHTYGQVFAEHAAKTKARRWAFVAPNYEFGHSLVYEFQTALKERAPDVKFVETQFFPTLKIEAGLVAQAVAHSKADGIFFAGFGSDLPAFVREGKKRNLFKDKIVISALSGQPEQLEPLGKEAPSGWVTKGFPYNDIKTPAHKKFLAAYQEKYGQNPGWFAFVGYNMLKSIVAAIKEAKSAEPLAVATALEGLEVQTTAGPVMYRTLDHQSTLGLWVGKIGFKNGKPTLMDWVYEPGEKYYPGDDYVKTVRP